MFVPVTPLQVQGGLPMVKIAFVVAAAALTTAPPFTPAKAQGVKMAQVDMQGRHFDDRDPSSYYGERRRRSDSNKRHCWRRSRRCRHRPTTALPHGDYQD